MSRQWIRRAAYSAALAAAKTIHGGPRRRYALGILKLDKLGDGVLALGAIRRMQEGLDEAELLLIVSPLVEALYRAEFPKAGMLVLPAFCHNFAPDFLTVLLRRGREVCAVAVERLVCLRHQPSDYLHGVATLLGAEASFATRVDQPWESVCLRYPRVAAAAYPTVGEGQCLELEAHRRVVELALGVPVAVEEVLPTFASVTAHDGPVLLLCPHADSALRVYPPMLLAQAIRRSGLARQMPVEVCLPPGADDAPWRVALEAAEAAVRAWHRPPDAAALCRLIAEAGLVLANESAPAHMAVALDKRAVLLLGGGHHGLLAPWRRSGRQRWICNVIECYHCRWDCKHPQPYCLTEIAPETVAAALDELGQTLT